MAESITRSWCETPPYHLFSLPQLLRDLLELLLALVGRHLPPLVEHLEAEEKQQKRADVEGHGMRDDHGGVAQADGEEGHESERRDGASKHQPSGGGEERGEREGGTSVKEKVTRIPDGV